VPSVPSIPIPEPVVDELLDQSDEEKLSHKTKIKRGILIFY